MGAGLMERRKVWGRSIIFPRPLALPEGTEVIVQIQPFVVTARPTAQADDREFRSLPFFGMWADREDMQDSAAWVRKEREAWFRFAAEQFQVAYGENKPEYTLDMIREPNPEYNPKRPIR
jgi:hypothetical protein